MTYHLFQNNRRLLLGTSETWENLDITQIQNTEYLSSFVFYDILCGDLLQDPTNKQLVQKQAGVFAGKIIEFAELGIEGMYIARSKTS
jgi:hypothetical protein